jgi:hypothetical protein
MTEIAYTGSIGRRSFVNVMLRRSALLLMLGFLAGCAGGLGQTFMVSYMPFSATPDAQGQAAVQAAVAYANANPLMPVTVDGFHYGQFTGESDTMGEQRVNYLVSMLVAGGIGRERIDIQGEGIAYAQGSPMGSLPPGRVKIGIGL